MGRVEYPMVPVLLFGNYGVINRAYSFLQAPSKSEGLDGAVDVIISLSYLKSQFEIAIQIWQKFLYIQIHIWWYNKYAVLHIIQKQISSKIKSFKQIF